MDDSILMTIRKLVCGDPYATHFDTDLLIHINTCFSILSQLGVGPENGFFVTDESETWSSYTSNVNELNMVRTYIPLKVKTLFDPPLTSSVLDAMNKQIAELEWRLNVAVDKN
jgi:hypothetical protein